MKPIGLLLILILSVLTVEAQSGKYVFVFLYTNPDRAELPKAETDRLQAAHVASMEQLTKAGKLLVAGPFDGGGGILILNTTTTTEAEEWIATDPAVEAGRFKVEVLPWQLRVGGICPVGEPYEMVGYTFVQYNTHITKFNVQRAPQLLLKHDEYLQQIIETGNVISEGVFDNSDGGIMIMKGDVEQAVVMADPTVQNGIIIPKIRKLWVAKGVFCE